MMNNRSRLGISILGSAAFLGVLDDHLFQDGTLGLNLNVFIAVLAGLIASVAIRWWNGLSLRGSFRWEATAVLVLAAGFLFRDAPALMMLDLLGIIVVLVISTFRLAGVKLRVAGIADYLRGIALVIIDVIIGTPRVAFSEVAWNEFVESSWKGKLVAVGKGLVIVLPAVMIFALLFISSDPIFGRMLERLVGTDLQMLMQHFGLSLFFTWVIGGVLVGVMGPPPSWFKTRERTFSIGVLECVVVLGTIDLLFGAFVLVQIRYLFGGAATGLSFAEYARHGFFELVGVAMLDLPLLLAIDWVMHRGERRGVLAARLLSALQILLLIVIVISALYRMNLYQDAYGQTELRYYTSVFMWWMGFLLLWFCATVLRGERRFFASGAVLSGFAVVLLLNILNPAARIAETNCGRAGRSMDVDVRYLLSMSADAVPTLVEQMPHLAKADRDELLTGLLERWGGEDPFGWNFSRSVARQAVAHLPRPTGESLEKTDRAMVPAPLPPGK